MGLNSLIDPLQDFFSTKGITHEKSCVYLATKWTGYIERKNRHILNVVQALRFQASLPLKFWGKCALTATHLMNLTPSKLLDSNTLYEILFNVKPLDEHIQVFGVIVLCSQSLQVP